MRYLLAAAMLVAALVAGPTAHAMPPGALCPGEGTDITVLGGEGGYCDFLFTPDGLHVHCEWGGFVPGMITIVGVTNCWRVDKDGNKVPSGPLNRDDPGTGKPISGMP